METTNLSTGDMAESSEPVIRFILHSKWIHQPTLKVKALAYIPREVSGRFELSTYRLAGQGLDNETRDLGLDIAKQANKTLHGSAVISARTFSHKGLTLVTDNEPQRGHTNVIGWPDNKAARKAIAQDLARRATLTKF